MNWWSFSLIRIPARFLHPCRKSVLDFSEQQHINMINYDEPCVISNIQGMIIRRWIMIFYNITCYRVHRADVGVYLLRKSKKQILYMYVQNGQGVVPQPLLHWPTTRCKGSQILGGGGDPPPGGPSINPPHPSGCKAY